MRGAASSAVDRTRLWTFFGALGALCIAFVAIAHRLELDLLAVGPAYMFTPALAAAAVWWRHDLDRQSLGLRRGRLRWVAIAALLWPPMALVVAAAATAVPGVVFDPAVIAAEMGVPDDPLWVIAGFAGLLAMTLVAGVTVNAVLAFGEELGWRGYLLWELAPLGFWRASVGVGLVWGLWHAPLVLVGLNYPSFPVLGVALFTVVCIAMSPIYTYLVVVGRSVWPAVVLHGVFNATGFVGLAVTDDPVLRELVASEGGLVGLVVFGAVMLAIHWRTPPALERMRDGSTEPPSEPTDVVPADAPVSKA